MPFPRPSSARGLRWTTALLLAAAAFSAVANNAGDPKVFERVTIDATVEERLLALVPEHISERDVQEVLARAPAPRIINLEGSVPVITMAPFAEFLIAMGYPEERIRNPSDGGLSYSSFVDARQLAGAMAWYYESEGMMPMLIGHSQGGMVAASCTSSRVNSAIRFPSGIRCAVPLKRGPPSSIRGPALGARWSGSRSRMLPRSRRAS